MRRIETAIPGVCLFEPAVHEDARGSLYEAWSAQTFARLGLAVDFVQDNHSTSKGGVLRGLHWQIERPQAKLVRVIHGAIFDVAVDLRRGSPTFGRWFGQALTAENRQMLFVPIGFAHGFYVLSEQAEVLYKCSDFYHPRGERGLRWDDPALGIEWPIPGDQTPALSPKDAGYPHLAQLDPLDLFEWRPE